MKKVFVVNGSGRTGKDTMCDIVRDKFTSFKNNFVVMNISSVDKVKFAAKELGWDGVSKTDKDRKFLSDLKDLCTKYNDSPFNYVSYQIEHFMKSDMNGVLFIHIREPEEIRKLTNKYTFIETILVTNKNVESIDTNHADREVENYDYDYHFSNDGTLEEWRDYIINKFTDILGDSL